MTETGQAGGAAGQPWSVDLLADLHAGVLDDAQAAALWPRVRADPAAMVVIEALDATAADLGTLGDAPAAPMPADVAGRIDAAFAAEAGSEQQAHAPAPSSPAAAGGQVVDLAAARRRRNRQLEWGAALLATAAAAVAFVAVTVPDHSVDGTPQAGPGSTTAPTEASALTKDSVFSGVPKTINVEEYGPLKDADGLLRCLTANGLRDERPVGFRPVTLDGAPAVLIILSTGETARWHVVAVGPECDEGTPAKLYDRVFGRPGK